jgi:hypothetical protein
MSNYNETTITGTGWQRCHTVQIANPTLGIKSIYFQEELVYNVGLAQPLSTYIGGCGTMFAPDNTFSLLDVQTGEPSGSTMTHEQLYQAIYSLYMQTAKARDEEAAQQAQPE